MTPRPSSLGLYSRPRTVQQSAVFTTLDEVRDTLWSEILADKRDDLLGLRNAYQRAVEAYEGAVAHLDVLDASPIDLLMVYRFHACIAQTLEDIKAAWQREADRRDPVGRQVDTKEQARNEIWRLKRETEILAMVDKAEIRWGEVREDLTSSAHTKALAAARLEATYLSAIGQAHSAKVSTGFFVRLIKQLGYAARETEIHTSLKEDAS